MGKKGKRSKSSNKGSNNSAAGFSMPPTFTGGGGLSLRDSLAKCSLRVLCDSYNSARKDIPHLNKNASLVSVEDVGRLLLTESSDNNNKDNSQEKAMAALRQVMERQMDTTYGSPSKQLPPAYRIRLMQELKGVGGMKITFVSSGRSGKSFCYTCGFTNAGGKELLIRNIHRSMGEGSISQMLNYLYHGRHMRGHPLAYGHTVGCEDPSSPAFFVDELDEAEATIVKATRCLEPTRLYGLHGYGILELVPVGVSNSKEGATRETVMKLGRRLIQERYKAKVPFGADEIETRGVMEDLKMDGDDAPEFRSEKLEACAYCHKVWDTTGASKNGTCSKLLKCSLCKTSYYCSKECQKHDWKDHKKFCLMTEEERLRDGVGCFADDLADLAMQTNGRDDLTAENLSQLIHNMMMKHS